MRSERILVAMSGGVDSAAAASLLAEQGHEVTGATLKLWRYGPAGSAGRSCCSLQDIEDARATAATIGIPYIVLDEQESFEEEVVRPFVASYLAGETPNPCVRCNARLKFGRLLDSARRLGFDAVATGHYARIEETTKGFVLKQALDPTKDQSYMLWGLRREDLPWVRFPLGRLDKAGSRYTARRHRLAVAAKRESQDVCFVSDAGYGDFINTRSGGARQTSPGDIVSLNGEVLGRHQGVVRYTVGQRRGLGVAGGEPLYVVRLDAVRNRVVVGREEDLMQTEADLTEVNWISQDPPVEPFEADVKIRYRSKPTPVTVYPGNEGNARISFRQPQRAVAPGQSAVFYRGDTVLGGGVIRARRGEGDGCVTAQTRV